MSDKATLRRLLRELSETSRTESVFIKEETILNLFDVIRDEAQLKIVALEAELAAAKKAAAAWKQAASNRSGSKLDTLNLQEIQDILNQEISWSAKAKLPEGITPQFRQGFIKGLEQARYLLEKAIEVVQQEE